MTTLVSSSAYRGYLGTGTPDAKSWFRGDGTWQYALDISNAAGGQIIFPATQNSSAGANTLDDYEEGTFTPTIAGTTTAGTGTYTIQSGVYTKVGQLVTINIRFSWTAHTGTGNIQINGLPFTTAAGEPDRIATLSVAAQNLTLTAATNKLIVYTSASSSVLNVAQTDFTGGWSSVAMDTSASLFVLAQYTV